MSGVTARDVNYCTVCIGDTVAWRVFGPHHGGRRGGQSGRSPGCAARAARRRTPKVISVRRHTMTQLLVELSIGNANWSTWYRPFSVPRAAMDAHARHRQTMAAVVDPLDRYAPVPPGEYGITRADIFEYIPESTVSARPDGRGELRVAVGEGRSQDGKGGPTLPASAAE